MSNIHPKKIDFHGPNTLSDRVFQVKLSVSHTCPVLNQITLQNIILVSCHWLHSSLRHTPVLLWELLKQGHDCCCDIPLWNTARNIIQASDPAAYVETECLWQAQSRQTNEVNLRLTLSGDVPHVGNFPLCAKGQSATVKWSLPGCVYVTEWEIYIVHTAAILVACCGRNSPSLFLLLLLLRWQNWIVWSYGVP